MTFREWLKKVDALVVRKFGVGLDDLPDVNTRDLYDDELTPEQGFEQVVEDLEWAGVRL